MDPGSLFHEGNGSCQVPISVYAREESAYVRVSEPEISPLDAKTAIALARILSAAKRQRSAATIPRRDPLE